jgi:NTE family protein
MGLLSKYPFKNLVFQGGGVKSYVYHGVLPVLEEEGILTRIDRVAGSSAGALMAVMLCFRLSAEETIDLYRTVEYEKIRSLGPALEDSVKEVFGPLENGLARVKGNLDALARLVRRFGIYAHDYAENWLHSTIGRFCEGNGRATFAEFHQRGFRDPYIIAVNITKHCVEVFSAETTPDVAVMDAVIMSGTIPFFFEAVQFDGRSFGKGDYYIDGGTLTNYPISLFDHFRFRKNDRHFSFGVNWETLGCRLFTPEDCVKEKPKINHIFNYAENIFTTINEIQNVSVDVRGVDRFRSIDISNCCVSPVDFDIKPSPDDPKYQEMVRTGLEAAENYLKQYRLPTRRFVDMARRYTPFHIMWGDGDDSPG